MATSKYGDVYDHPLQSRSLDMVFIDKVSVRNSKRPELEKMIDSYLKENDVIHVFEMKELGRSLKELHSIIKRVRLKGASIAFQQEQIMFGDLQGSPESDRGPDWYLELFSRFESSVAKKRQKEGIEAARKAGKHLGRPVKITIDQKEEILEMLQEGGSPTQIARLYGISRGSVYKILTDSKKANAERKAGVAPPENGILQTTQTAVIPPPASLEEVNKAIAHRLTVELHEKYEKKLSLALEELLVDILNQRHGAYDLILKQVAKYTGFTKYKSNYLMSRILPKLQQAGLINWGGERGDEIFWN